jgi:NADH-quinone oxidoreductase subunit F
MPCAGRCDGPIPIIKSHKVLIGMTPGDLTPTPSPLPVPNPGGYEECVFADIRAEDRASLDGYRHSGGYEALKKAVATQPAELIELIADSQLAGRGGAGFPTGQKWQAVAEATGEPKTVVCNADEGEPGCFKDRAVLEHDPHALLEGILLAAYATGATRAFIYLRYEYPEICTLLEQAIAEARAANLIGPGILGSDFSCELYIRRGAGAYICGEEGSLLNSLEGKHPYPRNRPPFPVTHGFDNLPTAVNNVETLASVPQIVRRGAE